MPEQDDDALKPLLSKVSTGLMTGALPEDPTLRPTQPGEHPPDLAIELGPRMTDLVRRTPLDDEAREQIDAVIGNDAMAEIRKPVVAVALMNCLDRRVAEMEATIEHLRALRAEVEKAGRGG